MTDQTAIKQAIQFNTDLYPGYTVIQINSECLTTQTTTDPETNGATFFAANNKGGLSSAELSQQWTIHYI